MITAKEARENCYKCHDNNNKLLSAISDFILEESNNGRFCGTVRIKAMNNAKYNASRIQRKLKQLGYDVIVNRTDDIVSFEISWADEDLFTF